MTEVTLVKNLNPEAPLMYMAIDLSHKSWKLAFSDGVKLRFYNIEGKNLQALKEAIDKAKTKFGLSNDCQVVSCFEAGRDGFWLDRHLKSQGIDNLVVDSSSIEVNRRKRNAKTDRIDARKLLGMLIRHVGGERKHWSIVQVPDEQSEDLRRIQREMERLIKERCGHTARMHSLLNLHGIVVDRIGGKGWATQITRLRDWQSQPLKPHLRAELLRENERLILLREQILTLEQEKQRMLEQAIETYPVLNQVKQLMLLRGIGKASAWLFVMEFFGWRQFKNRKQVASLAGLTPTPFSSGDDSREQGISKAGNRRIRYMVIEIAWLWLRYQPQSELSQWFEKRFAKGGKRMRRIGIVAMARKLLIALWRYLEYGEIPKGAILQS